MKSRLCMGRRSVAFVRQRKLRRRIHRRLCHPSLSGPGASIGIPYEKGVLAAHAYAGKVGDVNIKLIRLDDASDPSAATRNARKLVEEEKVDVLMGTSGVPGTVAMAVVAAETKTPMISLTKVRRAHRQAPTGSADFHSAGRRRLMVPSRGRAYEDRQRQEGRVHRLQRFLGRPRL